MRDAAFIKLEDNKELIITTDCCNGVGELPEDCVKLDIAEVARVTCRVALMELLALKGRPIGYSLNYAGDINKYQLAKKGFLECFHEFGYEDIPFISSSEKNFKSLQTSISITITGIKELDNGNLDETEELVYLIIGEPLWGEEVIENSKAAISTKEFIELTKMKDIVEIIPLGSGGAIKELEKRFVKVIECDLDLSKSAGPATCVLVIVEKRVKDYLIQSYGDKVHIIHLENIDIE